jgi:hypothetical protein
MRRQHRILIVGTNGTGKSTFADKIINAYPAHKKRLIVDPDGSEKLFDKYPEIEQSDLKKLSQLEGKIYKVLYTDSSLFEDIHNYFRNGLLVLDDSRNYTGSRDEDLLKIYRRSRQFNIDILFICHGLSEIPPSLLTFTTKIIMFNTVDSWQRLKRNIPNPKTFDFLVNYVRAKAATNPYFKLELDTKTDLIASPEDIEIKLNNKYGKAN